MKSYSDAYVVVGFSLEGNSDGISYVPMLYTKILDRNGSVLYTVNTVYFLVGDQLYTFDNLIESGDLTAAFLGATGRELLKSLATATEASFKVEFEYKSLSIDIPSKDFSETLKLFAQTIGKYDIFSLFEESELLTYDTFFSATVE